jgi:hypothetical protein
MQNRKTCIIDGTDREILRVLYEKRPLVSRQIATMVGMTASAIAPRLNNLLEMGILKRAEDGEPRSFDKKLNGHLVRVKSPKCIMWDLDIKY